LGLNRI